MNLGKYIFELLLENDTVIIPGFGAFLSSYKPAEIIGDEIKPPSKEISFTQQIRNNDGLLVGHVAEYESISHFDALKKIEIDRENIFYKLDKGEKVTIEKTGFLFYGENNKIEFEPIADDNLQLDSFGLETISVGQPKKESSKPGMPNDIPELEKDSEKVVDEEIQLPKFAEYLENDQNEEKSKRSSFWYLLILIPIIIAGIFLVRNKNGKEFPANGYSSEIKDSYKEEEPAIIEFDSLLNETQVSGLIDENAADSVNIKTVEIDIPKTLNRKYILVGGSFKEEKNAEKYLSELKEKGFEPFHLGKRGNFFIVGIGRYNTEGQAVRARQKFYDENPESGAWIMEDK